MAVNISKSHSAHNIVESIFNKPSIEEEYGRYKEYLKFFSKEDKLFQAIRIGNMPMLKMLIDNGYDVNGFDDKGFTILMIAASLERPEIVELLIGNGADVNKVNEWNGSTALISAVLNNNYKSAKILLMHGADPYIENIYGKTAFDYIPADDFFDNWKFMDKYWKVDENIFVPVSKDEYEDRRNMAGADLVMAFDNDNELLENLRLILSDLKFRFKGKKDDMAYFTKRIPYKGHRDLVKVLTDTINERIGGKVVKLWYLRKNHP